MKFLRAILVALTLGCAHARAHTLSSSFLSVAAQGGRVDGRWEIALKDLEYAVGLDADGDGAITWGELKAASTRVAAYALDRLELKMGAERVALRLDELLVDQLSDGAYAVLRFSGRGTGDAAKKSPVTIHYGLLFEMNPQHRGLLSLKFDQETALQPGSGYGSAVSVASAMLAGDKVSAVFGPEHREQTFERTLPGAWIQVRQFFDNGVWHILSGYDHIAFLLVLLLPAVFVCGSDGWEPGPRFSVVFFNVLKIVSAFSLAHTLTLSAAALGLVRLPSRLVESAIAASIVWGALSNFYPRRVSRAWQVAFAFGLMHGFGFASVLQDLDLARAPLLRALVSFNLGVEAGQLAGVAAFLPIAYWLRAGAFYRRVVFVSGSGLLGLLGAAWLIERVFNVALISKLFTA